MPQRPGEQTRPIACFLEYGYFSCVPFVEFTNSRPPRLYLGGKFFNNFCMALSRFFCFFSWFALASSVLLARPVQTSCLVAVVHVEH